MSTTTVGIRELKARLSYYLQQVKAGATLVITEHNRPIGKIVPANLAIDDRLQALLAKKRDRTHCLLLTAHTSLESWITTHLKAYSDLCLAKERL